MKDIEVLAKKHYDKHRNNYETKRNRAFYGYFCDEMVKEIYGNGFKNILEIGCGTGISTEKIASKFKGSRIHAFDISKKMLEIAQKKPALKNVVFYRNIEDLPGDNFFDLVISNFSYHWWSNSFCCRIKKLLNGNSEFAVCAPLQNSDMANGNFAIAKALKKLKLSKVRTGKLAGITKTGLEKDFYGYEFTTSKKTLLETFDSTDELIETLKVRGSLLAIATAFGVPELELESHLLQNLDTNGSGLKMHWDAMVALKINGAK